MVNVKHVNPTVRGQITIPKEVRRELGIKANTKLKIYIENNRIVIEPVSHLDLLFKDIEEEAKAKGYTEEELCREIEMAREKLVKEIYKK